ncbi:cyclopropane-fatty-acyl-phospholipid synthase family protein [Bartonella sp. HY329]|uniref:SAM-dependent methyltransferase n=1 Tax=unclassified Bartonella TaxID=2645622 RepID=UPI0021C958C6|nr:MULTISPECIES: cyclopropane-fatty-acyl-phospholipid synthase family protein [unclassified Bartonella]UXM94206.1 cyclopropane-fatty-acyl-phospholipid synthase family protein [Bartonella sp. HY329]UXN08528.1 cyclopropane-fatty-acyl-phospholipid synthase family protein [Bartonella sp. HY328]
MFSLLTTLLKHLIKKGNLIVTDASGTLFQYGDGEGCPIHVRINNAKWEKEIALDPALKFGEAYMNSGFDFLKGDIYSLLELIFTNSGKSAENELWMRILNAVRTSTKRFMQMNNLKRSSGNIRQHYDLSGQLYDLFLDSDKQYSCAYFETPDSTLEEAQLAKKRHLAAKLSIKEGERLLDIGCGWGGLGLYMARFLKANVTGVTLSHEQHAVANQRAKDQGLEQQCRFLLQDYRLIKEQFDKIVSVGMFEHVGIGHYKEYFSHVKRMLKPDGVFVLHSIGRNDVPGVTNPFIRKYVFPGGYIPALSEVIPIIEKTGLVITDIEILRLHYADTLKAWRERFLSQRDKAKALYDERFCRMWEFYLAASESAFRWQNMMVFHIQLAHRQDAVPITRDYIAEEENRLRNIDLIG